MPFYILFHSANITSWVFLHVLKSSLQIWFLWLCTVLFFGWTSIKSFPSCWIYVSLLVTSLNYSVINLGKLQEPKEHMPGVHLPLRESARMQGPEKTWRVVSTSFPWVALPTICSLTHCALKGTQMTVGRRPSFSRRSEYGSAGVNWVPPAAAGAAEGSEAQPWAQERSCCVGKTEQARICHLQWKTVIMVMVA